MRSGALRRVPLRCAERSLVDVRRAESPSSFLHQRRNFMPGQLPGLRYGVNCCLLEQAAARLRPGADQKRGL